MKKRRVLFHIILVISLLFPITLGNAALITTPQITSTSGIQFDTLTSHDPIVILDNDDFSELGFPGIGTVENPFRIEDISISTLDTAIAISGTSAHFLIRNCFIVSTSDGYSYAISLSSSHNGIIENCTVSSVRNAISLRNSHNTTIRNNTVSQDMGYGIDISQSDDCIVNLNIIRDGSWGISLHDLERATISFNLISETRGTTVIASTITQCSIFNNTLLPETNMCLELFSSSDSVVANNSVQYPSAHGTYYAFQLAKTQNISLIRNSFVKNGIRINGDLIEHWNSHTIEYNIIDGAPIAYIRDGSYLAIDASSYGEVILANSSHCTISNGVFDDCYIGVLAGFCNNLLIENCSSSAVNSALIKMEYCNDSSVSDCHVENSVNSGIAFSRCINSSINYCTATGTWTGISLFTATNTNLTGCTLTGNYYGVESSGLEESVIIANVFQNNGFGISAGAWSTCLIQDNSFIQHFREGLRISNTDETLIIGNTFFENHDYGFRILSSSYNNTVYNNTFIDNGENALDDGNDNRWDDGTTLGNTWDDFNGSGFYYVLGSAGSVDHYPSVLSDLISPTITGPSDLYLSSSVPNFTLTWYPDDENPYRFELMVNSTIIYSGNWNGSAIEYTSSNPGTFVLNFTLIVYDFFGNSAADSVMVVIQDDSITTTTTPVTTTPTDGTSTDTTSTDTITTDTQTDASPTISDFLLIAGLLGFTGLVVILVIVIKMKAS